MHAVLLTVYLLCNIIVMVMNKVFSIGGKCDTTCEYSGKCDTTCEYIYFSIYNIAATIGNVCEVIIFAFVVYS
jgi:hypothetical protein